MIGSMMSGYGGCPLGADDIEVSVEKTKNGLNVKMTSEDAKQIELLHEKAEWMNEHHSNK